MMKANWAAAFKALLGLEGGRSDSPADHGGRTNYGVTQATYDAYRRRNRLPVRDVYAIAMAEVEAIYHGSYWEPYCDQLPAGVDYMFFQFAVNAGPFEAMVALQEAVRVAQDGVFGPVTAEAVETAQPKLVVQRMAVGMIRFYEDLGEAEFERGWHARTATAEAAALAMIGEVA